MKLPEKPTYFAILTFFISLFGGFAYLFLEEAMGLDAYAVYLSYCIEGRDTTGVNFFHSIFVASTCIKDFNLYFITYLILQSILIAITAYKIRKDFPDKAFLFLCFLGSPTIIFYGSTFTKDGTLILFLLLSFIFSRSQILANLFLVCSTLIRPHIAAIYPTKFFSINKKLTVRRLLLILFFLSIILYLTFFSSMSYLYVDQASIKFIVTQETELNFSRTNVIFYLEALIFIFLMQKNKMLNIYVLSSILVLGYIAAYNPNVLSRMIVSLLFANFIVTLQKRYESE